MTYRFFVIVLVLSVIFQLTFSIYYSSEIINQNNNYYQNQIKLEELKEQHQILENRLSQITSINHLQQQVLKLNLVPISQHINLNISP